MSEEPKTPARRPSRLSVWSRRVASIALGIAVGLVVTERIFDARDDGAFPHLNVYIPDAELGVRLRPGASQRVAFGGNPVTSVRINADGFRGAELPPPSAGEILVVGDSQVFGLGVEEGETFSAELTKILATKGSPRAVINAGVPTYGPAEYRAVVEEQIGKRRPAAVIYVVNFVNDLFEASRPNRDRHRVWDGWAVRAETAPDRVTSFPGRDFLFRRSHAFYALRRLLLTPSAEDQDLASEGTHLDLLREGGEARKAQEGAERETERLMDERKRELERAGEEVLAAQVRLEDLAYKSYPELEGTAEGIAYRKTHGNPGDILIIEAQGAEAARPGLITAKYLLKGAEVRAKVEKQIRDRAAVEIKKQAWQDVLRSFEHRADRQKRLAELHAAPLEIVRSWSPLLPELRRVKALCDEHGAKLLVVALPMDVQVSKEEWTKYGRAGASPEALDMEPSKVLIADLVDSAESIGALALDVTPALSAAEPGAFLNADIHMTPKGHRAVAEAIAAKLDAPPPAAMRPMPALPVGRSFAPDPEAWEGAKKGSLLGPAGCAVKSVREWALVVCNRGAGAGAGADTDADTDAGADTDTDTDADADTDAGAGIAGAVSVQEGGHGEAMTFAVDATAKLLAPVLPGEKLVAEILWADGSQRVRVVRPRDGSSHEAVIEAVKPHAKAPAEALAEASKAKLAEGVGHVCACQLMVSGKSTCSSFIGAPDRDCERTYRGDCKKLLECSRGSPIAPPKCLPGWVNAGGLLHCYKTCGDGEACEVGVCTEREGAGRVCM